MMDPQVAGALAEPGQSKLQMDLLAFARRRLDVAERRWSQRHPRWRESERLDRAFRVPDAQDQNTRNDQLTLGVEKIVVPYTYAVIRSMLAFIMATLTQRTPLIPVQGKGPKDVRAGYIMEALLDSQAQDMSPSLKLAWYQWFLDTFRYGVGIIKGLWTIEEWPEFVRKASPIIDPFTGQSLGHQEEVSERDVVAYEGNALLNVSPFDFYPDPRRNMADFQRGEFVFHRVRRSFTELRRAEAEGLYAGIEHIPRQGNEAGHGDGGGSDTQSDLARIADMGSEENEAVDQDGHPYVTLHEGYAYLDPPELGLPGNARATPPLWVLTIANRARVIRAEPANLPGRAFPFNLIEVNYDWHSPSNFGMIEVFRGLQYYYSWLFTSRMQAVRKTLNNEMVYDPSMVEEIDLLDPEPGRLIRLKREVWGDGRVRDAMFPIPVQDTTAGHLNDAGVVQNLIQVVAGAPNNLMGSVNTGRRAATEVQNAAQMASSRLRMLLEIFDSQGLRPQAKQMVKNTQVFLDLSQPLALKQPWASLLGMPYVQLTPDLLAGSFDHPFLDAGLPNDKQMEASVWKELLMAGIQGNPALLAQMPWAMILARFLRALNVRDLQSFGLSPLNLTQEPMPDEQVQNQVQQGNLEAVQPQTRVPNDGFAQPPYEGIPGVGANGGTA